MAKNRLSDTTISSALESIENRISETKGEASADDLAPLFAARHELSALGGNGGNTPKKPRATRGARKALGRGTDADNSEV